MQTLAEMCKSVVVTNDIDCRHLSMHNMIQMKLIPQDELQTILESNYFSIQKEKRLDYLIKNPNVGLMLSAEHGFIYSMFVFKSIGGKKFNDAIKRASCYCGDTSVIIDIVKKCIEWGATDIDGAMRSAVLNRKIPVLEFLKPYDLRSYRWYNLLNIIDGLTSDFSV